MRVKPLADVCPIYKSEDSKLPDAVRLAMNNSMVLTYELNNLSAAEQYRQKMNIIIHKWHAEDVRIGYKARHVDKKERRRERLSRAASRK